MKSLKELLEERAALYEKLTVTRGAFEKDQTDDNLKAFQDAAKAVEDHDQLVNVAKRMESLAPSPDPIVRKSEQTPTVSAVAPIVNAEPREKSPIVPASIRRPETLKAFKGEGRHERAYRAGRWLAAALFNHERSLQWCKDHGVEVRAANETTNFLGGYLVAPEFSSAIIDLREEYGVFRREAMVVPMGSDTLTVPRRASGLTAYFVSEGTAPTESDKNWTSVNLTARKMATLSRYSSELAEDAIISIADDLASEIAYAFSLQEDQCGFLGDGTSTYGGIFGVATKVNDGTHAASIFTSATGNTAFGTLDIDDFLGVVGQCPLYARGNAKWFISAPGFSTSMQRLSYAAGGNTVQNVSGGTGLSFLGYPVVLSQVMNSTLTAQTSTIVALFGDLRKCAMFGDRSGISVDVSNDRYFDTDQIAIRGKERFDINVHDIGSSSVAGPVIALKTASS